MHALATHNFGWIVCKFFRSLFHALKNQRGHRFFQAVLSVEFSQLLVEIIVLLTLGSVNSDWKRHGSCVKAKVILSSSSTKLLNDVKLQ